MKLMTKHEGSGKGGIGKTPDLWLKRQVNDGATHQGTNYGTSCRGVSKLTVKGKKSVLGGILCVG